MKSVKLFFATLSISFLTLCFLSFFNNYQEEANETLIESITIITQENMTNALAIDKKDTEQLPPNG